MIIASRTWVTILEYMYVYSCTTTSSITQLYTYYNLTKGLGNLRACCIPLTLSNACFKIRVDDLIEPAVSNPNFDSLISPLLMLGLDFILNWCRSE